jgi:hypothetical protein
MIQAKWFRFLFCILAYTLVAALASCGGGGGSSQIDDTGNPAKAELPNLPMEYTGEFTGTFSGSFTGNYQQTVTILFTPRRQSYLSTLTVYLGANRDEGEVYGLLNADKTEYEIVSSKESMLPGNMFFQLLEENSSVTLSSYNGIANLVELSKDEISVDVDISLEGVSANNELLQVTLKGNITASQQQPTLHVLSDFVMTPTMPGDLLVNEIVTIEFKYHTIEANGVRLWNMPIVNGGSYSTNGSPTYPQGDGVGQVSFQVYSVSGDTATVDSTTVIMVSADQQRVLAAEEIPLDYTYFQ